jgi:hypothetical protein
MATDIERLTTKQTELVSNLEQRESELKEKIVDCKELESRVNDVKRLQGEITTDLENARTNLKVERASVKNLTEENEQLLKSLDVERQTRTTGEQSLKIALRQQKKANLIISEKKMINNRLVKNAKKVDKFLINYLKKQEYSLLINPMKYGVISGGKKIRSTIIFDAGKIFKLSQNKLINICAAVECMHSYSLIHDDLPCMDNDFIRRGKPSAHIKFGEASAVLAGNSLLTLAFEIIADKNYLINPRVKNEIVKSLAFCSGHTGIAGGQELDLKFENKRKNPSYLLSRKSALSVVKIIIVKKIKQIKFIVFQLVNVKKTPADKLAIA